MGKRRAPKQDFSKPFVVKIQVPIMSNDPEPKCLVYNEDRSFTSNTLPADDPFISALMEGEAKAYFEVRYVGTKLELLRRMPDQDW